MHPIGLLMPNFLLPIRGSGGNIITLPKQLEVVKTEGQSPSDVHAGIQLMEPSMAL